MSIFDQIQTGEPRVPRNKVETVEHSFEALSVEVKTHKVFRLNSMAANHIQGEAYHVRYIVDVVTNKPVILAYIPQNENESGRELSNSFSFRDKSLADRIGVPSTSGTVVYYRLTPVNQINATSADGRSTLTVDVSGYVAFEITEQISAPVKEEEVSEELENNTVADAAVIA